MEKPFTRHGKKYLVCESAFYINIHEVSEGGRSSDHCAVR